MRSRSAGSRLLAIRADGDLTRCQVVRSVRLHIRRTRTLSASWVEGSEHRIRPDAQSGEVMMMRSAFTLLAYATVVASGAAGAEQPPSRVVPWKPAGISSPQYESHAAFDPRNGDLYFVRSTPSFTGWRM